MNAPDIIIIGAGPQGLAAASHAVERDLRPLVLEAGSGPAAAVAEWAHVRLFSDWSELIDPVAQRRLESTGWSRPGPGIPTGGEWIDRYLAPLADSLDSSPDCSVRYNERVVAVERAGDGFVVRSDRAQYHAPAVLDASGTWRSPRPAGAGGLPAPGEEHAAEAGLITYRIPDAPEVATLTGAHVVVVGSGHSAATAIGALTRLAARTAGIRVTWVMRRSRADSVWGGGDADALPARAALGDRARRAVESGAVELVTGFRTARIGEAASRAVLVAEDGRALAPADRVIVLTGFEPDLTFLSTLRLDLDPVLRAPARLAPEIDPAIHSCGTVAATGIAQLAQPEKGFVIVGAKSYGNAPTFLALTGYEQVRSVVAHLAGDTAAAARNELVLPETGVCGGTADDSCCAPAGPQPIMLGRTTVSSSVSLS